MLPEPKTEEDLEKMTNFALENFEKDKVEDLDDIPLGLVFTREYG